MYAGPLKASEKFKGASLTELQIIVTDSQVNVIGISPCTIQFLKMLSPFGVCHFDQCFSTFLSHSPFYILKKKNKNLTSHHQDKKYDEMTLFTLIMTI